MPPIAPRPGRAARRGRRSGGPGHAANRASRTTAARRNSPRRRRRVGRGCPAGCGGRESLQRLPCHRRPAAFARPAQAVIRRAGEPPDREVDRARPAIGAAERDADHRPLCRPRRGAEQRDHQQPQPDGVAEAERQHHPSPHPRPPHASSRSIGRMGRTARLGWGCGGGARGHLTPGPFSIAAPGIVVGPGIGVPRWSGGASLAPDSCPDGLLSPLHLRG